jgi:hypothetical protein
VGTSYYSYIWLNPAILVRHDGLKLDTRHAVGYLYHRLSIGDRRDLKVGSLCPSTTSTHVTPPIPTYPMDFLLLRQLPLVNANLFQKMKRVCLLPYLRHNPESKGEEEEDLPLTPQDHHKSNSLCYSHK